ncbi:hypothetical protein UFOVP236_52 [uncultured Caudovirales phage]|uniref:Uncharacterized protein n=1 Tax=uncultured Caudovirales phage TaxID=2100421 RepID=A0A6J7WRI4_9CAUD|nr:hypothetical protein UFOVP236_52 [uncultured Caudovirales phage]
MSILLAKPPVEVDVSAEAPKSQGYEFVETALAAYVHQCWERAKFSKTEITERLLKCERQRRGVYDPDKAMDIAKTGGSDIYMRLTDIKCRAAASWIKDVMTVSGERPFDLSPAKEPQLPPEIKFSIIDMVKQEAMAYVQSGAAIHPEAFRTRMEQVHDEVMTKMREEAKDNAKRMKDKIDDQLSRGGFDNAFRDFIDDYVTYPTAIMKGPVVRRRKRMEWGPNFTPIVVTDLIREFTRVSPFDIFPSPNSSGPNDGWLIERHRLSRGELQSMRGVPGYNDENIDQVLNRFGETGLRNWLMGDQERDNLEGKPHSRLYNDAVIEAIEFHGSVSGDKLINWGMKTKDIKADKEYEVNCWQIGPYVIKAILNPDPLGKRPYDIAQWNEIPGAFWGSAMPEQMRDVQTMCNASARALANNMGIASGPQAEVTVDRLPDGEDVTSVYPWKIWQVTSDRTGGGQPAVRFFQPEMNAQVLMGVYAQFAKQADEVTGIPNYVYGSGSTGGAGRTASGLSMLMDNAAKGIKQAIASIDHVVSGVVNRMYIHNMMYDPDIYIKGDFNVVAKGALGLVAKEQVQMRRNEFLQATANPIDMQIVGMEGRAYLLREVAGSLQMDTDKIIKEPERIKFEAEQMQQMQMEQMQQAQAAQGQQPQLPAPTSVNEAGDPAGGTDANTMNGAIQ